MRNRTDECPNRGESPAGPFTGAVARDIASAIHDGLTEGGLMSHVIREVACALLAFSLTAQRDHVALPTWGRKTKFFSRGDDREPAPVLPKPDRGWAEVVSPEPRILCALLLDVSGSMFERGALEIVPRALAEFRAALVKHEETTRRLSWAVMTYAAAPQLVQPYGPIAAWEPPAKLKPGRGTAMGTAILEMLRFQEEHINALAWQGISYQHAFCFHRAARRGRQAHRGDGTEPLLVLLARGRGSGHRHAEAAHAPSDTAQAGRCEGFIHVLSLVEHVVSAEVSAARILVPQYTGAPRVAGPTNHRAAGRVVMSTDEESFWQLGRDARTGEPLPSPFCGVSAKDVARVIHDDLTELGLSCHAIRKIACALLGVSARTKLPPARRTRGEKQ